MVQKRLHSPFKFLDSYQREDYPIFFGRESDAEKLYEFVNINRTVLVYGPLGSGKTSLIQCGLANKFEVTDWVPFFIKRGSNINQSLLSSLLQSKALGGSIDPFTTKGIQHTQPAETDPVLNAIQLINARYLRPVYLIFDQFEELLILGTDEEKQAFIKTLKSILESEESAGCHILIVMREEYLAWLDPIEKEIPGITDRKMRVEVMRSKDVANVILKTCAAFDISLESPEENALEIIRTVSVKSGISLPYLQVYLDQLYKTDYKRTYGKDFDGTERLPITFTTEEIQNFGKIEEVLKLFLNDRKASINRDLNLRFPTLLPDTLSRLLDAFVSNEGTKRPVSYIRKTVQQEGAIYKLAIPDSNSPEFLKKLNPEVFTFCVEALEKNRILRDDGSSFELAHDTLALVIDNQRTDKQRRLYDIQFQIQNAYRQFPQTKEYLTFRQIKAYEDSLDEINLEPEQVRFFEKSRSHRENEEYRKKKAEGKTRRLKIFLYILIPVILLMFYIGTYLLNIADRNYALKYLAYDLKDTVKSNEIPVVAGNIYQYIIPEKDRENEKAGGTQLPGFIRRIDNYLNPGGGYRKTIENEILQIFHQSGVQSMISDTNFRVPSTSFSFDDIDISSNGEYIVLNFDSSRTSPGRYAAIDWKRKRIDTFANISYAYFTSSSDSLLLAAYPYTVSSSTFSAPDNSSDFPNRILVYDFGSGQIVKSRIIGKSSWLYPKSMIFNPRSRFDSYRVQFTNSGTMVVPFMEIGNTADPSGYLLFESAAKSRFVRLDMSVSISPNGNSIIAGRFENRNPVIEIYNDQGEILKKLNGIYFADFTNSGNLMFIRKGSLNIEHSADSTYSIFIDSAMNNVFADNYHAIGYAASKQKVFLINLQTKKFKSFRGILQGFSFDAGEFIYRSKTNLPGGMKADTIWRINLKGENIGAHMFKDGIHQLRFNQETGKILVFTRSNQLYLLDRGMNVQAGFQLTPNDIFGFSGNGKYIYYIRDNSFNIFDTGKQLVNFLDFHSTYQWVKKKISEAGQTPVAIRRNANIRFPKEILIP